MQYVHVTNLKGFKNLINIESTGEYDDVRGFICASSMNCKHFVEGDKYQILTIIEGEPIEKFSGDIGFYGGSPRNTQWDEIHVKNGFHLVGLYIPNIPNYWDDFTLQKTAFAKYFALNYIDFYIDVVFQEGIPQNVKDKFNEFYDNCYNLTDDELQAIFEEENI